jgi:hypothetical protein
VTEDRTWMAGGSRQDLKRAIDSCCRASEGTCTNPPCPCNLDSYSKNELVEIEARRAGAVSFNGEPVEPL